MKHSLKYLLLSAMFFEEMRFTYLPPLHPHSYQHLFHNLQYPNKTKPPLLLHVITKKPKPYHPPQSHKIG
ncbi:1-deoxy-D-xylulose-5-phosphate synthase N-terminal domain-containing protein, partial [Bacillus pumilus]|uniref:1-deoxy-D-xylulose-5-phosphate synthase N-terminal domain-containing protein n=1 Tax=Bacillus pumilus TaxID=1408 RepID=UPI003704954C